ncbi:MAG: hypothetical protein HQL24_04635 [Candidatus Omnitrophica bacterium]|nr:hypothetical protein [Candidatus Omnitrophota bacterium]
MILWSKFLLASISLFWGRKLYWALAGLSSCWVGIQFIFKIFPHPSNQTVIIGAVAFGLIGVMVALFIKHLLVMIAGFIVGGYAFTQICTILHVSMTSLSYWGVFIIGGFILAAFFMIFFELVLIFATALCGAYIFYQMLPFERNINIAILIIPFFLGINYQFTHMRNDQVQRFKNIDLDRFLQKSMKNRS